jgi:AcrR family transcriptional regulator
MSKTLARKAAPARKVSESSDRKPKAERWEELLQAAAAVFYEKGYDAATLQEIAERVGILKGSIYYYIETKADLRNNLLVEVHTEGLDAIRRYAASEGSALDKLEVMIRGHIEYVCKNLVKTTIYLQELKKLSPEERGKLLDGQSYRDVFLEVIELGQQQGSISDALDSKLAAQAMLGSLNSVYQWYRRASGRSYQAIADHFVTTLLSGHAVNSELAKRRAQLSPKSPCDQPS